MEEKQGTRINKFLSEIGYCSRREADKFIEQGRVTINGRKPQNGSKVSAKDEVRVDGELVSEPVEDFVYLAFNKPAGIVSTTDTKNEPDNIIDYIAYPKRIFPIGRLDKLSDGLIFLTNDGDIVNKILRASNNHEKEYLVTVHQPITADFIKKMGNGIPILGTMTKKCRVEQRGPYTFMIILTQGLNRQIRRMCEYLNYDVKKLRRVRIMNIPLDIPVGHYREFSTEELREMNKLVSGSSKTTESKSSTAKKKHSNNRKQHPISEDNVQRPKKSRSKSKKAPLQFSDNPKARVNRNPKKSNSKSSSKRGSKRRSR